MELLLVYLVGIGLAFAAGWHLNQRIMLSALTEMIQENIATLTYEVADGQHFLYFKDDGKFAAQGSSLEEAARNFNLENRGLVGRVIPSTGTEFYIVDGIIETETETT